MSVTSVHKDPEARTMTITARFDAPVGRVWQLWADPRQLERWWGPPTHPATVVEHDLRPGGTVSYVVTGADGDQTPGWWHILAVDAPHGLQFELGGPAVPTVITGISLNEYAEARTRMVIEIAFASPEAMEQLITLGLDSGMATAVEQAGGVLRADPIRP